MLRARLTLTRLDDHREACLDTKTQKVAFGLQRVGEPRLAALDDTSRLIDGFESPFGLAVDRLEATHA